MARRGCVHKLAHTLDARLRRSVAVVQRDADEPVHQCLGDNLAAHLHPSHRRRHLRERDHRRHVIDTREPFGARRAAQHAEGQQQPELEGVKAVAGGESVDLRAGRVRPPASTVQQVDHSRVRHHHALRLARAPRRVDHVRKV
eukprot:3719840-Prymnesium_polylepis.3